MAERINDDEDNQSDVQGRIPRFLLVIMAVTLILNIVWLAWLACVAIVPIFIQAYITYMVRKLFKTKAILYIRYNIDFNIAFAFIFVFVFFFLFCFVFCQRPNIFT